MQVSVVQQLTHYPKLGGFVSSYRWFREKGNTEKNREKTTLVDKFSDGARERSRPAVGGQDRGVPRGLLLLRPRRRRHHHLRRARASHEDVRVEPHRRGFAG